jgi:hypothetical protein
MLGLAAVAATALMVLGGAATASATTLCKSGISTTCAAESRYPAGTAVGLEAVEAVKFRTGSTTIISCTGNKYAAATDSESGSPMLNAKVSSLTWTGCTFATTVLYPGSLAFESIAGTTNGTLWGKGAEWLFNSGFFGECIYGYATSGTRIATITGGSSTVNVATTIPLIKNKSGLCSSTITMEGRYKLTSPNPLYITS